MTRLVSWTCCIISNQQRQPKEPFILASRAVTTSFLPLQLNDTQVEKVDTELSPLWERDKIGKHRGRAGIRMAWISRTPTSFQGLDNNRTIVSSHSQRRQDTIKTPHKEIGSVAEPPFLQSVPKWRCVDLYLREPAVRAPSLVLVSLGRAQSHRQWIVRVV